MSSALVIWCATRAIHRLGGGFLAEPGEGWRRSATSPGGGCLGVSGSPRSGRSSGCAPSTTRSPWPVGGSLEFGSHPRPKRTDWRWRCPPRLLWRARQVWGARLQPTRSRSRDGMSGWPRRGGWREGTGFGSRHGPGARCCSRRCCGRLREGGRPPPRAVALDREAPPGECAVEGRGGDHGTARLDPGTAVAGARGCSAEGRIAIWLKRSLRACVRRRRRGNGTLRFVRKPFSRARPAPAPC